MAVPAEGVVTSVKFIVAGNGNKKQNRGTSVAKKPRPSKNKATAAAAVSIAGNGNKKQKRDGGQTTLSQYACTARHAVRASALEATVVVSVVTAQSARVLARVVLMNDTLKTTSVARNHNGAAVARSSSKASRILVKLVLKSARIMHG